MIEVKTYQELRANLIYPFISFGNLRSMNALKAKAPEFVTSMVKFGAKYADGHILSGISNNIKPNAWTGQQISLGIRYAMKEEYKPHLNKKILIDGREYKLT